MDLSEFFVGEPSARDETLKVAGYRLRAIQDQLASSSTLTEVHIPSEEVSADNVAVLVNRVRSRSARISYLYAILGFQGASLRASFDENTALSVRVSSLQADNADVTARAALLTQENNSLIHQTTRLQADNDDLTARAAILQQDNIVLVEEVARLQQENVALVDRAARLQDDTSDLTTRAALLQQENSGLVERAVRLEEDNHHLERDRDRILGSKSWRITAPFRLIVHVLKRRSQGRSA